MKSWDEQQILSGRLKIKSSSGQVVAAVSVEGPADNFLVGEEFSYCSDTIETAIQGLRRKMAHMQLMVSVAWEDYAEEQ